MEWQQIETAPMKKDCLFYESTDRQAFVGRLHTVEEYDGDKKYYVVYTTIGECNHTNWKVTHWMPLPTFPDCKAK